MGRTWEFPEEGLTNSCTPECVETMGEMASSETGATSAWNGFGGVEAGWAGVDGAGEPSGADFSS